MQVGEVLLGGLPASRLDGASQEAMQTKDTIITIMLFCFVLFVNKKHSKYEKTSANKKHLIHAVRNHV